MNKEVMIPLHCHTDASNGRLIDSINKVEQLIDRAVSLQYPGLAITDHETVSNHVRAIRYVNSGKKKGNIPQDFKLILGNEIYLVDEILENINGSRFCDNYYHFILLAKDSIGHRQLRELSSGAWDNSFYTGKMERVPTLKKDLERVVNADPGHLIACTACVGGEIGKRILNYTSDNSDLHFNDPKTKAEYNQEQKEKIVDFLDYCLCLFGDDFYLELQPNDSIEQTIVNTELMKIAKVFSIPIIITTDAHYLSKEDRMIHEAYLQSHEEEREVGDFYKTTYMMDTGEIHGYLDSQIGELEVRRALAETLNVGNKVESYDLYHPTIVPGADVPEFELSHFFKERYKDYEYIAKFANSENIYDQYLLKLIEDGYIKRIPYNVLSYEKYLETVQRINDECMEMWLVTEKLGTSISSYYLLTLELIDIMWNEGDSLVGVARGSVTGMFTMYLIGLIQMNPMQWGLPYWRHISHSKIELSDVDVDTQANRRAQIINAVKKKKGDRRVLNCCTFKTEKANSAILAAGRGLGIDPDITSYIAGMIPVTRGESWSIIDCLDGNPEKERKPVKQFSDECKKYPGLLEVALGIEGLICGRSIHASAVYLFNEDFLEHNARMKAPNGIFVTQFNMKDSDYQSGLKLDFLTIEALDKIRTCMDLLVANGYMEWQGSLRATYDKYLHPDVLDYDTREMWDWIAENKVPDLFQFDTQVGLQAARRIKPHSLIELAAANSIMRLMVSGEGAEQPIDTYIRFKNDINQWYSLMRDQYHLTDDEICTVEVYLKPLYGVGDTQEVVMEISMDQKIAAFNVKESNLLRKGISKKDKDLQAEMKKMFFERGHEIGTSNNLLNYIWNEVVGKQLGYSFSKNHTFPYSVIGLQELNLAYHYPIIYWCTACLSINAGADEEQEGNSKSADYGKIATAIANMQHQDIEIALPLINEADFGFKPDEKNNRIIYGLKGLCGVGEDVVRLLIDNRPYTSMKDFYKRMIETGLVKPAQMISLIKAGCFTKLSNQDRRVTMREFIYKYKFKPVTKLSLTQLKSIQQMGIIPEEFKELVRIPDFKKYVLDDANLYKTIKDSPNGRKVPKCGYYDRYFKLDEFSQPYYEKEFSEVAVKGVSKEFFIISEREFSKICLQKLETLRDWFNSDTVLEEYNSKTFENLYAELVPGNVAKWEMDSLSFYYTEHELAHIDRVLYGIENYKDLPEEPEIYDTYTRTINNEVRVFPKYRISRLAGTVINTKKDRHMITLLTLDGVVNVKFNKGQFGYYNRRISAVDSETKKKKVIEESWFTRGNKIMVCGYMQDTIFRAYRYQDTIYKHTVSFIDCINEDGTLCVRTERKEENV